MRAAAVGSFKNLRTLRPAIAAASLVAYFYLSLKYAGHVITAFVIGQPSLVSAAFFKYSNTKAEISSGHFFKLSTSSSMYGFLSLASASTLKAHFFFKSS